MSRPISAKISARGGHIGLVEVVCDMDIGIEAISALYWGRNALF